MALCYMCPELAINDEHVPPKVLFPERKDLVETFGEETPDFRKDLITVPACTEHNNCFSKDDEYTAFVLASYFKNGPTALLHWRTKCIRALRRSPGLASRFTSTFSRFTPGGLGRFEVDSGRLTTTMEKTARGLYYHHTTAQWLRPVQVLLLDLRHEDGERSDAARSYDATHKQADRPPWQGTNPSVFKYTWHHDDNGFEALLCFYGGFHVAVAGQK